MFVLEYNCKKESEYMKEIFKNKFLLGAIVVFWLSLYLMVALQTKVEARNQESFEAEVSLITK